MVGYQNISHRFNWGAVVQQVPYITGAFAEGESNVGGEPALVEQQLLERQTNRDFMGLLSYPFSPVQRVEFRRASATSRSIGSSRPRHFPYHRRAGAG